MILAWVSDCSWPPQSVLGSIFLNDLVGFFQEVLVNPKYIIFTNEVKTRGEQKITDPLPALTIVDVGL